MRGARVGGERGRYLVVRLCWRCVSLGYQGGVGGVGAYFQNMGLNAIENAATGGRVVSGDCDGSGSICVGMGTYLLDSFGQSRSILW